MKDDTTHALVGSKVEPVNPSRRIRTAVALAPCALLLCLAGCKAEANEGLPASELTYSTTDQGWTLSITIDPWLGSRPDIVRKIREWRISNMLAGDDECYTESGTGCEESASFEVHYDGTRLVSVLENSQVDTGGAHPRGLLRDHLFDLQTGDEIRFGDLFASWAKARPIIQREFCAVVRPSVEDIEKCPDIQKQAITLRAYPRGLISTIVVSTQDYELGYYAAGNGPFDIEITPDITANLKPEYRSEFGRAAKSVSVDDPIIEKSATTETTPRLFEAGGRRGPGSCKMGDPLQFHGGWAVGAGGVVPFENPAVNFENFLARDEATQSKYAQEDALKFDRRGGCTGVGQIDPATVYLSQPLSGGEIRGGKFLVVGVNGTDEWGAKRACLVLVRSTDVTCAKGS